MTDIEKLVASMECCIREGNCHDCAYECGIDHTCISNLLHDALDVIRPKEPHCLTLSEILNAKNMDVYLEETCQTQTHPILLVGTENESKNQAAFFWPSIVRPLKSYGKIWRCWCSKPSEEQRKAVKWDG